MKVKQKRIRKVQGFQKGCVSRALKVIIIILYIHI